MHLHNDYVLSSELAYRRERILRFRGTNYPRTLVKRLPMLRRQPLDGS